MIFGALWNKKAKPASSGRTMQDFVRQNFPDAVAFAAQQWMGYEHHVQAVAPEVFETHGLEKVALGFLAGPIYGDLDAGYPAISEQAAAMVRRRAPDDSKQVMLALIVGEGMIATGIARETVEGII